MDARSTQAKIQGGRRRRSLLLARTIPLAGLAFLSVGCLALPSLPLRRGMSAPGAPSHLGQISDQIYLAQENNAEAADFTLYDHEFEGETIRLTLDGQDHLKQIAARLQQNPPFPVIVERTTMSISPRDKYPFPVRPNPELDQRRRELVIAALTSLGVPDASNRVIVSTSTAPGFDPIDIRNGINSFNSFGYGGGGGFGGSGGFGGFGGGGFGGIGGFGGFGT